MDKGVEFVAADMPFANKLTVHILAAVAEHEREMIAERTRAALAAAKARGVKLGGPKLDAARQVSLRRRKAQADRRAANVVPVIDTLRRTGLTSLRAIAEALNARGVHTPRGGLWHASTVRDVLRRTPGRQPC